MASFQAKTGQDRQRMREKIKYRSSQFLANPEYGIPKKIVKKFKKLKNIIMASFQVKTGWVKLWVMQKKKSYRSNPFQPGPKYGFPKKQQKMEKKKKETSLWLHFKPKQDVIG